MKALKILAGSLLILPNLGLAADFEELARDVNEQAAQGAAEIKARVEEPERAVTTQSILDLTPIRPSSIIDPAAFAGVAAASPLRSLKVSPALVSEYRRRVSGSAPISKTFQAAVVLLAHNAGQGFVKPADQEELMRSLLDVRDGNYAEWIKSRLVPNLRNTLSVRGIPGPNGASWNDANAVPDKDVLIWTIPGLSAYVDDTEVFPAAEQVQVIVDLLRDQRINQDDMDSLIAGLAYARVLLRMPPHIRALLPATFIRDGRGALLAPLEAAVHHDASINKENRFPVAVLWAVYDYDDRPELVLGRVHEYIGLTYRLAYESVKDQGLKDVVAAQLKKIMPEGDKRHSSDLTEESRHAALLRYIGDQNPIMAIKLLTPWEQYLLGLAIADAPGAERLKSQPKIKDLILDVTSHGTTRKAFQAEIDAFLQAGDREPNVLDARRQDQYKQIQAARELRANMLVILASAMSADGIPANQAKFLLPKAAEFMKKKVGSAGLFSKDDINQEIITKTLYQMRANKTTLWLHEFEQNGMRDGNPHPWGLTRRGLDNVPYSSEAVKATSGNMRRPKLRVIAFSGQNETDFSYKQGTFRVTHDEHDDNYYSQFSVGEKFIIMLVNNGSRKKFGEAQIDSIQKRTIETLTMNELKSEVDFNSQWSIFGDKSVREDITERLIKGLQSDYHDDTINRKTEGYMILFHLVSKHK